VVYYFYIPVQRPMYSAATAASGTSNYEVTAPWSQPATDEEAIINRKLRSISSYQYESLWQPIEVTALRKQQLANHRLVPPFETSDAILQEPSKYLNKANASNHMKTLAPWEHGTSKSLQHRPCLTLCTRCSISDCLSQLIRGRSTITILSEGIF
jgi:hypothetical protein